MRWFLSFLLSVSFVSAIDTNFELQNTNILSSTKDAKYNDYNRLRLYATIEDERHENYLVKIILDNENTYTKSTKENDNDTNFYRGYVKYSDDSHLITLGKQRVPYGVGRVWNPIDIYNPIDATAVESDQRKGVEALHYEYAISDLSSIDTTISNKKSALRIKGYVDIADMALLFLNDTQKNSNVIGYELQGEIASSGVEVRSEGGYFKNKDSKDYKEFILGGEYGFENSLNILFEYKHNTLLEQEHIASNISYTLHPLLLANGIYLKNIDDKSSLTMVKFDYSLSDDMELNIGGYFYNGKNLSEYGSLDNSFFIRYFIHF